MTRSIDFFIELPNDVLLCILVKLPSSALNQLRCVSKFFKAVTSNSYFINLHLSSETLNPPFSHHLIYHESTDYKKICFSFLDSSNLSLCKDFEAPFKSINGYLRLVGSVRGLICLFDTNYFTNCGTLTLWNPFIGKFMNVAHLQRSSILGEGYSHMVVGFGFDCMSVDFKVVKILYHCEWVDNCEFRTEVLVYPVKTGSWKRIMSAAPCFMPKKWSSSVSVNGILHWLACKKHRLNPIIDCIMGFDVANEVFNVMELPQTLGMGGKELFLSTSVGENTVSLFVSNVVGISGVWSIWTMNEYEKVESWTNRYNVMMEQIFIPMKTVSDTKILAAAADQKLVVLDLEGMEFSDLQVYGLPPSFYTTGYMPSLALVDAGQQPFDIYNITLRRKPYI